MATAPDIDGHDDEQGLNELKREITCPLCLDTFREPKLLSCNHVYCKSPCLEALLVRSRNSTISCPECRVVTQVTANEVNSLRTAFHVNRLKEVVARLKKFPLQTQLVPDDEGGISTDRRADRLAVKRFCKLHPSQSLDIFCSTCTCQRLICRDCVVVDRTHENHDYDLVEKVVPGYKKALLERLDSVQETQGKVAEAISQVKKAREQVLSHGDALENQITVSFDSIAALFQQKKDVLVARVRELEKADLQDLNGQEKNLCIASDELSSLMTSAQTASNLSNQEFFARRQELVSRIVGLTTRFKTDLFLTPTVTFPHIGVRTVNAAHKVDVMCKEFSIVCDPGLADPTKCLAEGVQTVATVNEPSSFKVYLLDLNGNSCSKQQHVHVELKSPKFSLTLPAKVTAISSSCYYVMYTPQLHTRGRYQLDVMVNNRPIANSPITVYIKCQKELGTLNKKIMFSQRCFGLCFNSEGNLLVVTRLDPNITHSKYGFILCSNVSQEGGIQVFDQELNDIKRSITGLLHPYGIATDSLHNVYVVDQAVDVLYKYTKESKTPVETCMAVTQFHTPIIGCESCNSLKISKDDELYVCDDMKHQINVFNSELTYMRKIGKRGSKPGQFNIPHDLSFDSQGNIYVTDSKNYRVQVLTREGEFIRMFGAKGDKPGEFLCPNWIHVDGEFVYVTDYRSRYVSVFNVSGEFIHRFGADILGHPEGIVVDKDGFVYVADSDKCKVFVF